MKAMSWVFPRFEFRSFECLFHALDCLMRLLGEMAVLLGAYKLRILAVEDCLTDVSTILVFVCKNRVILAEFQHGGELKSRAPSNGVRKRYCHTLLKTKYVLHPRKYAFHTFSESYQWYVTLTYHSWSA